MPLYEGILNEKMSVILDIGDAYTRCGFVGEAKPRRILKTQIGNVQFRDLKQKNQFIDENAALNFIKKFLHHIFYKHLLVNPKERRIVVIESMLSPSMFREVIAKVLFKHFEVASILYVPSHLMALYTLGISSGLVLDVGYTESLVIPIYQGVPILCAWESLPIAGKAVHREVEKLLLATATVKQGSDDEQPLGNVMDSIPEEIIEDIKVKTCFVSPLNRATELHKRKINNPESLYESLTKPQDVHYPLNNSSIITIPGPVREDSTEILFFQDNDLKSVSTIILDSLVKCSIDTRKELAKNIIIMGGTSMTPGFKHRLLDELKKLVKEDRYASKFNIEDIKVHKPPAKENNVAWLGASIFSDKEFLVMKSVVKKDYLDHNYLPDWCNLQFNTNDYGRNL